MKYDTRFSISEPLCGVFQYKVDQTFNLCVKRGLTLEELSFLLIH